MLKIAGITLSVLLCSLLLKEKNRAFAVILSVAGGLLLLSVFTGELSEVVSRLKSITEKSEISASYIALMLKALGITIITQFVSDICRDNGENALASITETVAKIAVIAMLLPLFETIIEIVSGLVK